MYGKSEMHHSIEQQQRHKRNEGSEVKFKKIGFKPNWGQFIKSQKKMRLCYALSLSG